MITIHKIVLAPDKEIYELPSAAKILYVAEQRRELCLWYQRGDTSLTKKRRILVYGTGHEMSEEYEYIGTAIMNGGSLVFHVFEDIFYDH